MPTTADILVDTLIAWKVSVVFGLPGEGINGIMEALRTRQEKIAFVQVRHEESAAFMATAYAKWTGKLGVCLAASGPGGTHLLTGLYDARLDQAPVLAITGQQFHDLIETFTQQDVDLTRVFNDVAVFNAQVTDAAHMENIASRLPLSAVEARRRPPRDRQRHSGAVARACAALEARRAQARPEPVVRPLEELDAAAEILNRASRVAILVGRGALGARTELERTADLLGAPVAKALLGKAVLPDRHPLSTGGIGPASGPSARAMRFGNSLLSLILREDKRAIGSDGDLGRPDHPVARNGFRFDTLSSRTRQNPRCSRSSRC